MGQPWVDGSVVGLVPPLGPRLTFARRPIERTAAASAGDEVEFRHLVVDEQGAAPLTLECADILFVHPGTDISWNLGPRQALAERSLDMLDHYGRRTIAAVIDDRQCWVRLDHEAPLLLRARDSAVDPTLFASAAWVLLHATGQAPMGVAPGETPSVAPCIADGLPVGIAVGMVITVALGEASTEVCVLRPPAAMDRPADLRAPRRAPPLTRPAASTAASGADSSAAVLVRPPGCGGARWDAARAGGTAIGSGVLPARAESIDHADIKADVQADVIQSLHTLLIYAIARDAAISCESVTAARLRYHLGEIDRLDNEVLAERRCWLWLRDALHADGHDVSLPPAPESPDDGCAASMISEVASLVHARHGGDALRDDAVRNAWRDVNALTCERRDGLTFHNLIWPATPRRRHSRFGGVWAVLRNLIDAHLIRDRGGWEPGDRVGVLPSDWSDHVNDPTPRLHGRCDLFTNDISDATILSPQWTYDHVRRAIDDGPPPSYFTTFPTCHSRHRSDCCAPIPVELLVSAGPGTV